MTTNVEVPEKLDRAIEEVYEEQGYVSKSEFVRDGIRELLKEYDSDVFQPRERRDD